MLSSVSFEQTFASYTRCSIYILFLGSREGLVSSAALEMYEPIAECYAGKSVLITGATGFIGKVVLEKLLYSCPKIDKIYILVREKDNTTTHERVRKMLELPLFSRIKEENPEALEKIIPVAGEISEPDLGMKSEDQELLIDMVSFVFHVAANIKFNDPLEKAINVNVKGTGRVLDLSRRMRNIEAFVYVSTAYSNTDREVIEEVVYTAPLSLNKINKILETGITEKQTMEILNGRPNTYTFSKAIAENFVADNHGNVPAVIIRPSIVSASHREPVAGWTDNWFGPSPFVIPIMKGLVRVLFAKSDCYLDVVPVDYVSNLIVVAAARCKRSNGVDVYNCSTSGNNPIKLKQLADLIIADSLKHKFNDLPMPMVIFTPVKWLMKLIEFFLQTLPSYIADMFLFIRGIKTRYVKLQAKMQGVRDKQEYFISKSWFIYAYQTRALYQSLSSSDRAIFPCDPSVVDWIEYVPVYCKGIRQFLLII